MAAATALKQRKVLKGKSTDTNGYANGKLRLPLTTTEVSSRDKPGFPPHVSVVGERLIFLLVVLLLLLGSLFLRHVAGPVNIEELPLGVALADVPYAVLPYASPRLLSPAEVNASLLWNTTGASADAPPLLHFVHTRFCQEQGHLVALAWARLFLFETVCLPTMVAQTVTDDDDDNNGFLWLIRVDPHLDARVLQRLRTLVQAHDHIYLVASNVNFRIQRNTTNGAPHRNNGNHTVADGWRDGGQGADLAASRIYTGNLRRLEAALAHVHTATVVDTRLDADDGLHVDYLRTLQALARADFNDNNVAGAPQWKYWCARRHLAWHWSVPTGEAPGDDRDGRAVYGSVTATQHDQLCITPGLSVAFRVGVNEADVPVFAHHELVYQLNHAPSLCGAATCWAFVQAHAMEAIRSRTPTSAGMAAVVASQNEQSEEQDAWLTFAYWDMVHDSFDVSRNDLRWMHAYLTHHLADIVLDNLHGQCTTGHSCKVR
jgi:hypothetical protein